ncbi:MAG TPA: VWA domain-containing protein [Terriglobales bacterium]|nr:VWA domain-containing protein [Terriglobales bacterium]
MTLADPRWLWGLAALPLLLLLEILAARRARRGLARLLGERPDSVLRAQILAGSRLRGALLRLGAFAALLVGAAGPQWGRELVRRASTGSDVVLVMDVSASMDTRDVAPSRLDEARREALAVLERLEGSRVAVVAFAGDAVRLCPLTFDRSAARLTLESLSSSSVSTPGTDLGRALRVAAKVLPPGRREEQAVVLWTDGEDLEGGAREAVDGLVGAGVRVFAVGVGTPTGGEVPVLDEQGRAVDVKREPTGGPVVSRLDEGLLRSLARRTHGGFFSAAQPGGEIPRLLASLGGLTRSSHGIRLMEQPVPRFRLLASLAILLLAMDRLRAHRRRQAESEAAAPLHSERGAAAAVLLLVLLWPATGDAATDWARGDRSFRDGRWAEAESLYARRLRHGGPDEVRLDLALARVKAGDEEGGEGLLGALALRGTRAGRAAGYDFGTLLGRQGEIDRALAALRATLRRDPADDDARWNYEVLLRRREEKKPENESHRNPRPESGGGSGAPQPQPAAAAPASGAPRLQAPAQSARGVMSRTEADRLLDALNALERTERERQRKVRVTPEKRGKDW